MSHRPIALLLPAALLLGCPALTRPSEGDPGYGPASSEFATTTAVHTASASATTTANPKPNARPLPPVGPKVDEGDEEKIRASHILVGWKGAAGPPQQRTKDEARARVESIVTRLKKGEDFGKLAAEFGEDGTKNKGGDLGEFDRGTMVKPFADAAFLLKPGEVSGVVETQFGFHLIKRTK
jgi:hypothetical protein